MMKSSELLHKTILVGITYLDSNEQLLRQEQFCGIITSSNDSVVEIKLKNSDVRRIPNDLILDAPRGTYECVANGEIVKNPDYLASWLVKTGTDHNSPMLCRPNYAPLDNSSVSQEWKITYSHDPDHLKHLIEAKGSQYIGKHVLVGLTRYRQIGGIDKYLRNDQLHGHIIRVSFNEGVVLSLSDGTEHTLPPDLPRLQPAKPGEYVLASNGEKVSDVDYVTRWIITESEDGEHEPDKRSKKEKTTPA